MDIYEYLEIPKHLVESVDKEVVERQWIIYSNMFRESFGVDLNNQNIPPGQKISLF